MKIVKRIVLGGLVLAVVCSTGFGVVSAEQIEQAMKRAAGFMRSISIGGGYVGICSPDLKQRFGESFSERARPGEIWVQPPGTPTVGQCYLRAWRLTDDRFYLEAVREVAQALVWGQRQIGGWDHRVNVGHLRPGQSRPQRKAGNCTFDDDITQGALRFLIDADAVLDEPWLDDGIELGLRFMHLSQFPNGAWPQWYPLRGGYHDCYTFNDGAINDCIAVMLKAYSVYGRREDLACAERGGQFIIDSQLPAPQAGWAQQYDHKLKPAWARSFEPPGLCSAVTARNIRTLVDLYRLTHKDKYLAPIEPAIDWLKRSAIGPGRWARLYEVGTNRPIYGDRTRGYKIFYDYQAISEKERNSYGWQGEFGIGSAIAYYRKLKQGKLSADEPGRARPVDAERLAQLADAAQKLIDQLDSKGRWLSDGWIKSEVFVENFSLLCDCLEALKARDQGR